MGNPNKEILQEKLLMAYNIELIDKVATIYRNYHNCHYRIYQKKKSHVSFACTRYQVIAPGLNELPWADYKSCVRFINKYNEESKLNITQLDIKNNSRSCPGKMIVNIVNGTVGLPYFPHPFHLCGNVSSIPNMDLGQQDLRPTFQLMAPTLLFKDVLSIENRRVIIEILDKNVKWTPLTGGCKRRFYAPDLASRPEVLSIVERVMKPLIDHVQAMYPSLVCVKLGALQTLPQCPSQYKGHQNRFHSDYESNYPEIAPAQRPVSVILALDPFDFMYLPHITQKRKDIVHLTVPAGHAVIFTESCMHAGGANDSTKSLYRLFAYMVSSPHHFPTNEVFKYYWNGADNDMDATIAYSEKKGGDEGDEDGDTDDGGGKPKCKSG